MAERAGGDRFCPDCGVSKDLHPGLDDTDAWECEVADQKARLIDSFGGLLPPITVMVSKDERDHIDMLHRQSYELAVERGHMRRG